MRCINVCGLLLVASVVAVADEAERRSQLQATRQQWLKAFHSGDAQTVDQLETDDITVIAHGRVHNKTHRLPRIVQRSDASNRNPQGSVPSDVNVTIRFIDSKVAIVSGQMAVTANKDELQARLAITEVWWKTDEGWRVAHLHFHQTGELDVDGQQSDRSSRAKDYVDHTRGRPPNDNLVKALQIFSKDLEAVAAERRLTAADLGAGAGNETIHLLKRNWDVVAIDIAPYAIETIKQRAKDLGQPKGSACYGKLAARLTSMEEMSLEEKSFDLVNASLSLPFVPKSRMQGVWTNIVRSLKPGGIFTGHFFGPEHAWKDSPEMSFYSNQQLFDELFNSALIEVRYLTNEKKRVDVEGGEKVLFHTITVIAQKRPSD